MGLSRTVTTLTVSFALLGGGVTVAAREGAPLRVPLKNPAVAEPARSTDPSPAAAPPCGPSSDAVLSMPDASAPGGQRAVWVHRPAGPDYADLPVVYLLHGYPADPAALAHGSLPGLLDREMCRTGRPFVLAVPDGGAGRAHRPATWQHPRRSGALRRGAAFPPGVRCGVTSPGRPRQRRVVPGARCAGRLPRRRLALSYFSSFASSVPASRNPPTPYAA